MTNIDWRSVREWFGVLGGAGTLVATGRWLLTSRKPPLQLTPARPMLQERLRVFVLNATEADVHVIEVYWVRPDGGRNVILEAPTPPFNSPLSRHERRSFDIGHPDEMLQLGRRLVVVPTHGRPAVIGRRELRRLANPIRISRVRAFVRMRITARLRPWIELDWLWRRRRSELLNRKIHAQIVARFMEDLGRHPPVHPWPNNEAAQALLEIACTEDRLYGRPRHYTLALSEAQALYGERLSKCAAAAAKPPLSGRAA